MPSEHVDSGATTALAGKRTPQKHVHHTTGKLEDQLMASLDGKIAVITGGSSGIGLATAQRFVQEGAYVFITGRRQSELDKAQALIGDGVTTVAVDSTNSADQDTLFATVLEEKGALDILVVNSGRVEPEELGKITEQNFDLTFDLNARATLFTVQKALPLMREGGSVILVGSVAGYMGIPGYSTYSATKAALRSYTRTWTREFTDRGIRFNTLSPGPIDTPIMDLQADSPEGADAIRAAFAAAIPLNRMGRPEEIAAAALFLASDDSSFVAGAELSVDGGFAQV
jgi:NAD(P)-dependent dehydrogenase (short-subunit alcohol dehydrogenase family)